MTSAQVNYAQIRSKLVTSMRDNKYDFTDNEVKQFIIYMNLQQYFKNPAEEYVDFRNACLKLVNMLNSKQQDTNGKKLYVIAPGDSPFRLIYFIMKLKLCPNVEFIIFPLSDMVTNMYEKSVMVYIESYLPEVDCFDSTQFVLLDYIARGSTIYAILIAMTHKYNNIKGNFNKFDSDCSIDLSKIFNYKSNTMHLSYAEHPPPPSTKHVINVSHFFKTKCIDLLIESPNDKRCIPVSGVGYPIPEHKTNWIESEICMDGKILVHICVIFHLYYESIKEHLNPPTQLITKDNIGQYINYIVDVNMWCSKTNRELLYKDATITQWGYGGDNTMCLGNITGEYNKPLYSNNILNVTKIRCIGINFNFNDTSRWLYTIKYKDGSIKKNQLYVEFGYSADEFLGFVSLDSLIKNSPSCYYVRLEEIDNITRDDYQPQESIRDITKLQTSFHIVQFDDLTKNYYHIVEITIINGQIYSGYIHTACTYFFCIIIKNNETNNNENINIYYHTILTIEKKVDVTHIKKKYIYKLSDYIPSNTKECAIEYISDRSYKINGTITDYNMYDSISIKDYITGKILKIFIKQICSLKAL